MSSLMCWRALVPALLAVVTAEAGAQISPRNTPLAAEPIRVLESGPAPTSVQAIPNGPTTVQVIWQAASGASGYLVFRGASAQGPWVQVTPQPVTTLFFNDTGLAPFLEVFYRVEARYPDKGPGVSTPANTKTPSAHPTGFIAKELTPGAVQITWNPMPGAKEYWLTGTGINNGVMVKGTSHLLQYLPPGPHHYTLVTYFEVAPFGTLEGGDLAQAPTTSVNVTPKAPPPANLRVQQLSADRLRVTWSTVQGARMYLLQATVPGTSGRTEHPEQASFEHQGVALNSRVSYTVRALYPLYDVTKESSVPLHERKFEQGNASIVSFITSDGVTKTCAVSNPPAPGIRQTLAVIDTMLRNNPTRDSFVVALFLPPPGGNEDALRMVIQRGERFGVAQNEVDIGLAIATSKPKEIAGWDFCDQKPVGTLRQTVVNGPPVRGRLTAHQAFTFVLRKPNLLGVWSNKYHFDPGEFWTVLGGHRVTFTWIRD